ncbi:tetratricopeptide repeat protein [Fluviispira multicolorata]|uniref:Tetratricopeptide repeat protein n=1 Tax=Fluviispira multicolorata TaxID=2654512 RepID=A0A833N5K5_9BACT|nr:tetratricopeptide repeat protein [Fluviispira multicolorata]KAB8030862.1 tetratricopeptide repeat protein [Fluviispira multicolorata]
MQKNYSNYNTFHLETESNSFWREINPSAKSCTSLKKLLEVYAAKEEWEVVINLSSRAVLHLSKNYDRADFYHIWMCALNETFDSKSLIELGTHLVRMRHLHPVFIALALISFHFAGCQKTCLKIFNYLRKNKDVHNRFAFEACGLYLVNQNDKNEVSKGFNLLKKTCLEKNASYFSWRNYLRCLSQKDKENEMSWTYNAMHLRYPFAQEPYIVSSLIAIDEKNWPEAMRMLNQLLRDNPNNINAILALAQCYEEVDNLPAALNLLVRNNDKFYSHNYDYYYLLGHILRKIIEKDFDEDLKKMSLNYLEKSLFIANSLNFPISSLMREIKEIQLIGRVNVDIENNEHDDSNSLNTMQRHSENNDSESKYSDRKAG